MKISILAAMACMSTQTLLWDFDNEYFAKISSQYRGQIKFMTWLGANLDKVGHVMDVTNTYDDEFDVDNASGLQLDIIGQIVGVERTLSFQPVSVLSPVLDDNTYRFIIKAKIAQNHWDGTIPNLYEIWENIFPDVDIRIQDNQDMTFTVLFVSQNYSDLEKELIENNYIIPRPQGVLINYNFNGTFSFASSISDPYLPEIDNNAGFADINQTTGGTLGSVSIS